MRLAAIASLALVAAQPAGAVVHTLDLAADMTSFTSFTFGPFLIGGVPLSGFAPFSLTAGDRIAYTIAVAGPPPRFAVPGGSVQFVGVNFLGAGDPSGASTSGQWSAFTGGTGALPGQPVGTGCGNCLHAIFGQAPGGGFGFAGLEGVLDIDTLGGTFEVTDITLTYQVTAGVIPEPGVWALMVAGFGLVGAAARRRWRTTASA